MRDEYADYSRWKQWQGFGTLPADQARYFARELRELGPLSGKRVLEVGFGNGGFMSWARGQGAEVSGTEMIPELIKAAKGKGFDAGRDREYFSKKKLQGSYDAVMAFDVLEHMEREELVKFFSSVHALLKPGGHFLARFPNGDSPFGRFYQHGDLTHKTAIGGRLIEHLAARTGFRVVAVRNQRTQFLDNLLVRVVQLIQRGLRNLTEILVGYIYFNRRLPLDSNLVAHLVKAKAPTR